jgi:hypothetical protein
MAAKKRREPLLSSVARKLGQAAGTVTNLTQGFLTHGLDSLSQPPAAAAAGVLDAASVGAGAKTAPARSVDHPKKRARRSGTNQKTKRTSAKPTRSRN